MTTSRSRTRRTRLFALSLVFLAAACADQPPAGEAAADTAAAVPGPAPAPPTAPAVPADAAAVGLENAREPIPGVLTSAQPNLNQLEGLLDLGYTRFVSLRPATEDGAGWEEGYVIGTDLSFTRIAVAGADGLTRDNVEALDRVLNEAGDERTVLYCSSSNRVGALLALRAYWLQGATPEEALALGRAAGLTRLEPAVRELLGLD